MTIRRCIAARLIRQALPARSIEARPGDLIDFTPDEAAALDPTYWETPDDIRLAETVTEVKTRVGNDPDLAAEALEAERAAAKPRKSLIAYLEAITTTPDTDPDPKEA